MLSPPEANLLAILALGLLAATVLVWIGVALRRMPFTPPQSILLGLNYVLSRVLWRTTVQGTFSLPPHQGAVIVCNHRASLDPSFLYLATRRKIHWMVAKEFCDSPFYGWFLRQTGAIPVGRSGIDIAATKLAIRIVQEGGLVGLFPEGRINSSDELLLSGRPGVTLIALKAKVPVVPCYISGSPYQGFPLSPLYTSAKVKLALGEPIDLSPYYGKEDDRQVLEEVTKRLLSEIARLAGRPDFQPRVSGRGERLSWAMKDV